MPRLPHRARHHGEHRRDQNQRHHDPAEIFFHCGFDGRGKTGKGRAGRLALKWDYRWLSETARKQLERRLLAGPSRWRHQTKEQFAKYRAWAVLDRLYWLHDHGCAFAFDLETKAKPYRTILPEWEPEKAKDAAASHEGRGGFVAIDTSYATLLNEPLKTLLKKVAEGRGRERGQLIDYDPFAGLVAERPLRALTALRLADSENEQAAWGWQNFLYSQARGTDKERLVMLIARRLIELPTPLFVKFSGAATSWLAQARERLCAKDEKVFRTLFDRLVTTLNTEDNGGGSRIVHQAREHDWSTEAINAPAGNLAEALLGDPSLNKLPANAKLPTGWVERARALSALPGDGGHYALVIFSRQLSWFYAVDPAWTEANLISPMTGDGDTREAILAGFFWRPQIDGSALYARLKPILLELAKLPKSTRHRNQQGLSNLLLGGWQLCDEFTGRRWTTSDELKAALLDGDDDFRTQVLWQVSHWPWLDEKLTLLKEVWPKQIAARTPRVTARLCEIPFNDEENFPVLIDAILPLVSSFGGTSQILPSMTHPQSKILERYPERVLALLWAILPHDAVNWPYGTDDALNRIVSANEELLEDQRMIELMQRQNSR